MKRAIVTPAVLAGTALNELKDWLAVTTTRDDAPLAQLLRAAVEMCEAFTGQMPLLAECEEMLTATGDWQLLATRPVLAITGVEAIAANGARTSLPPDAYALELDADGGARIRLAQPAGQARIAVRFTAGLAPDWDRLPDAIRHGIVRLAAHHYRQRDPDTSSTVPPAAVAALWRPWRRFRLL